LSFPKAKLAMMKEVLGLVEISGTIDTLYGGERPRGKSEFFSLRFGDV